MTDQLPRIAGDPTKRCDGGPCPAIYELNPPGDDLGIQGFKAPDVAAEIPDMPDTEDVVRVPRKLIELYVVKHAEYFVKALVDYMSVEKLMTLVNRYTPEGVR